MTATTRKLAAIVFTDIVGYTSMMGTDEDRAFEVLSKNREIHKQLINKYDGTLIKEIGDGMLVSFNLVSDAVYCAIEIQKKCKAHDIPLKIGIHEGEMVFDGADVLGDGVNIASRLQEDAHEGCIAISGKVYSDIKNRKEINSKFVKEKTFKNVGEPIKVYKVLCGDEENQQTSSIANEVKKGRKKPYYLSIGLMAVLLAMLLIWKLMPANKAAEVEKSIAVLPFDYLSEEGNKQHLADGVMDAITRNLAKISDLKVIAGTSVEKYREHSMDVRDIGKELDVSYIIEGSFQLVGDQARLSINLINTKEGTHMWTTEYDREWSNIFKVQSEVSKKIADEIAVEITPETRTSIESTPTDDLTAYDFYLRGEEYRYRSYRHEDFMFAMHMYEKAVEIDSSFTLAWVGLAASSRFLFWFYYDRSDERINHTKKFLDHAISLDSKLTEVELEKAKYLLHCERKYHNALKILNKLITKYPKNADIYFWLASIYKRMGAFNKSIACYNDALKLDPSNWRIWSDAAYVYAFLRNYNKAEEFAFRAIGLNPSNSEPYWNLINLYYLQGELGKLKEFLQNFNTPINSIEIQKQIDLLEGNIEEFLKKSINRDGWVMNVQLSFFSQNYPIGLGYYFTSNKEKAIEYLSREKTFLEQKIETSKNDDRLYRSLGIVYAGLGEKTKALNAGEQAEQLLSIEMDALAGVQSEVNMAMILLMVEQYDEAIAKLEYLLDYSGFISVEYLKNHYLWRGFMKNEKYQALVKNPKYQIAALQEKNY